MPQEDTVVSVYDKLSYAHSRSQSKNFTRKTMKDLIDELADKCPNRKALIFPNNNRLELTFFDIQTRTRVLAQNMMHIGFQKGDLLAISVDNSYEVLITFMACASIGVVAAFFNQGFKLFEYEHLLLKTKAKGLLIFDRIKQHNVNNYEDILKKLCPEIEHCRRGELHSVKLPHLRHVILVNYEQTYSKSEVNQSIESSIEDQYLGCWSYLELAASHLSPTKLDFPFVDADDLLMIHYTSGTTGTPKGVVHRQFGLINCQYFNEYRWLNDADPDSVTINAFPMLHVTTPLMLAYSLLTKSTLLFPFKNFSAQDLVASIEGYKCGSILGSARMLYEAIQEPGMSETIHPSLKYAFTAGSMINSELVDLYIKKLGVKYFGNGYGMTETVYAAINHDILKNGSIESSKLNCYKLLPFYEAKVIDEQSKKIVPLNADGTLCLRSFATMLEYWDEPERTREAIDRNGWLNTGDSASMEADGRISIKGRHKETIKIYDSSIYPYEIETYINKFENVRESCVFGIKESAYKETICAWIILKDKNKPTSAEELRAFCEENFAESKVPKHFKFVETFSVQTSMGKTQRVKIAQVYQQERESSLLDTKSDFKSYQRFFQFSKPVKNGLKITEKV